MTTMTATTPLHDELTTGETAARLGVTRGHVRWLIAKGYIEAHKRGGINFLFVGDVDRYADDPQNRQRGVKGFDRTPRRYGMRWRMPARPVPLPDPVGDDVAALLEALLRGERDVATTTRAILARVRS